MIHANYVLKSLHRSYVKAAAVDLVSINVLAGAFYYTQNIELVLILGTPALVVRTSVILC